MGILSNNIDVPPLLRGPYNAWEWPVIHPISATHANMSPGL